MSAYTGLLYQEENLREGDGFCRFRYPRQAHTGRHRTFMHAAAIGQAEIIGIEEERNIVRCCVFHQAAQDITVSDRAAGVTHGDRAGF